MGSNALVMAFMALLVIGFALMLTRDRRLFKEHECYKQYRVPCLLIETTFYVLGFGFVALSAFFGKNL